MPLSVPEMGGIYATGVRWGGGHLFFFFFFWEWIYGELYVPCIYSLARWSNRKRLSSPLLCPLSVECSLFPLFFNFILLRFNVSLKSVYERCTEMHLLSTKFITRERENLLPAPTAPPPPPLQRKKERKTCKSWERNLNSLAIRLLVLCDRLSFQFMRMDKKER